MDTGALKAILTRLIDDGFTWPGCQLVYNVAVTLANCRSGRAASSGKATVSHRYRSVYGAAARGLAPSRTTRILSQLAAALLNNNGHHIVLSYQRRNFASDDLGLEII